MRVFLSIVSLMLLGANVFAQAPASRPAHAAGVAIHPHGQANANAVQDLGRLRMSDLIDCSMSQDLLKVKWIGKLDASANARFTIDGMAGPWNLRAVRGAAVEFHSLVWNADNRDTGGLAYVGLTLLGQGRFNLSAYYGSGGQRTMGSFAELPPQIRFVVVQAAAGRAGPRNNYSGTSIFEIRDKDPAEFQQYVADVLVKLLGRDPIQPGAVEAYRRLTTIPADPVVVAKVQAILDRLESRSADERAAATKDLHALGDNGVLAILRIDPASLTPEQSGRVAEFLAEHDQGANYPGRSDKALLIDLFAMDDPAIRAAAAKELGVNPDTPPDQLRRSLHPSENAASQPVGNH